MNRYLLSVSYGRKRVHISSRTSSIVVNHFAVKVNKISWLRGSWKTFENNPIFPPKTFVKLYQEVSRRKEPRKSYSTFKSFSWWILLAKSRKLFYIATRLLNLFLFDPPVICFWLYTPNHYFFKNTVKVYIMLWTLSQLNPDSGFIISGRHPLHNPHSLFHPSSLFQSVHGLEAECFDEKS